MKYKHLYTQGMLGAGERPLPEHVRAVLTARTVSQSEPAPGGTEGTKDETPPGPFEKLIIEVAELYYDVQKEKEKPSEKDNDAKKSESRQEFMQDSACKGSYDNLTAAERTVSLSPELQSLDTCAELCVLRVALQGSHSQRKEARAKRLASASPQESSSSPEEAGPAGAAKKTKKTKRAAPTTMTVRDYMDEHYLPDNDFEKILDGVKPTPGKRVSPAPVSTHALHSRVSGVRTGWKLLEDPMEYGYAEAALEKVGGGAASEVASSFRDHLKAHLEASAETSRRRLEEVVAMRKEKMELDKQKAEERRRELDLAERRLQLEEARAAREEARARRDEERERLLMQLLTRDRPA